MPPKTKTSKAKARPVQVAENNLQAEAVGLPIQFLWHGKVFTVDLAAMQYGRAAYALRVIANDKANLMDRARAVIDSLEAAIGPEQVAAVADLEPTFFDDASLYTSFFDELLKGYAGANLGESAAS